MLDCYRVHFLTKSRTLLAEKRYHQLARGPGNTQEVEKWLDEWMDAYHEGERVGLPEVFGDRAIRDFFLAIAMIDSGYSNTRQDNRDSIDKQNVDLLRKIRQCTMDEEIEKFRNRLRIQATSSTIRDSRTTLASDIGNPTLKGKNQQGKIETPTCLCGEKMWYSHCPYLVPSKAPPGWKEDPTTRTKVNDALKDTKISGQVKKSLERAKTIQNSNTSADVLTTIYTTLGADMPKIESFLIHDGGSNTHVCNGKSAHLYTKLQEACSDEYLISGTGRMKIESWGQMETAFESPTGLIPVIIQNVAFVGSFMTSVVSQSILDAKGIYLDTGGPRLYKDNITKYQLYRTGGHYTFTALGPPHPYPQNAQKMLTTTAKKPSYAEVARQSSFKSPPITPKTTSSAFAKLAKSRPPPISWHSKPKTYHKSAYMTMEDLFRKFALNKTHLPQSTPHRTYPLHQHTKLYSQNLKPLHSPVVPHSKSAATYHTDTISAFNRRANSQARKGGSLAMLARAKWKSPLETLWKGLERGSRLAMTSAKADKLTDGNDYEDPD